MATMTPEPPDVDLEPEGDEPERDKNFQLLQSWKQARNVDRLAAAALDTSADRGWRWFAARYLGDFNDAIAVDALTKLLADDERRLRQRAARSLKQIGPPARPAVPALRTALVDGEGHVRVTAAQALGAIGDKSAIPDLVRAAETTGWDTLHAWATASLVQLEAPEAAAYLVQRLAAPKAWQRRWAAGELAELGTRDALEPLRHARTRDRFHRRTYSRAIRQIGRRHPGKRP
jgi:HEAT repeat protein